MDLLSPCNDLPPAPLETILGQVSFSRLGLRTKGTGANQRPPVTGEQRPPGDVAKPASALINAGEAREATV
jgi:hypothetical protein